MLDLLNRVSAETADVRARLLALTHELDAAAMRLAGLCVPAMPVRLAAVADPPTHAQPPGRSGTDGASPAYHVAVEMAVAGLTRAEAHARLTGDFSHVDPGAILDDVYGFAGPAART
jgi:hypothetical protein